MSMIPQPDKLEQLGLVIKERELKSVQQEFDDQYIAANEIMATVGVTRASTIAMMNRHFPCIKAGGALFWKRTEKLDEFILSWSQRTELKKRYGL